MGVAIRCTLAIDHVHGEILFETPFYDQVRMRLISHGATIAAFLAPRPPLPSRVLAEE